LNNFGNSRLFKNWFLGVVSKLFILISTDTEVWFCTEIWTQLKVDVFETLVEKAAPKTPKSDLLTGHQIPENPSKHPFLALQNRLKTCYCNCIAKIALWTNTFCGHGLPKYKTRVRAMTKKTQGTKDGSQRPKRWQPHRHSS
jgi:hypothetical protein